MAIIRGVKKHINKNSKNEKRHIINKMKKKEFKYTVCLVAFFMIVFAIVGYNVLYFDNKLLLNDVNGIKDVRNVSSSSPTILLTNDDVVSDSEGLISHVYTINVENKTSNLVKYHLNLVKDEDVTKLCNCSDKVFSNSQIKYSLNGKDVETFADDMLVKDIILSKNETDSISFRVWIDKNSVENLDTSDYHFHGHFALELIDN